MTRSDFDRQSVIWVLASLGPVWAGGVLERYVDRIGDAMVNQLCLLVGETIEGPFASLAPPM